MTVYVVLERVEDDQQIVLVTLDRTAAYLAKIDTDGERRVDEEELQGLDRLFPHQERG